MGYPLVVSFHTGTEPYVARSERLEESCRKLDIPCAISYLPTKGTWIENVAMKGPFLHKMMEHAQSPLLWIDADGYLVERPHLLMGSEADFAIHAIDRGQRSWKPIGRDVQHLPESWPDTRWFLTGTMFFNNTELGRLLLEEWSLESLKRPRDYQQLLLQEVWSAMDPRPDTTWLPATYCSIKGRSKPPVIYHDFASTEIKNVVRA